MTDGTAKPPPRTPPPADTLIVAPSLLASDFTRMGEQIRQVQSAGVRWLHLDVMDGHFVPNLSMGPPIAASVRKAFGDVFLDAHLMVTDPTFFAEPFANAGCDLVNFQIETTDKPIDIARRIRGCGVRVGVTLNPDTPAEAIWPLLDRPVNDGGVDLVLVMSVFPGFGGQAFLDRVLPKCEAIRKRLAAGQYLQIDGGIDIQTIGRSRAAGCNVFVAGTAVFGRPDPAAAVRELLAAAISPPVNARGA